jgi:hypothetical protein
LAALLERTGFAIELFNNLEFDLGAGQNEDGSMKTVREKFFCLIAVKTRSLDLKG